MVIERLIRGLFFGNESIRYQQVDEVSDAHLALGSEVLVDRGQELGHLCRIAPLSRYWTSPIGAQTAPPIVPANALRYSSSEQPSARAILFRVSGDGFLIVPFSMRLTPHAVVASRAVARM